MPDYSKTVIYKITCNDPEVTDVYVGHTVNFYRRQYNHSSVCNNKKSKRYNFLVYQTIRDNGGWLNWSMVEVEQFPCADVYQAIAREGYWYKELNGTLNYCVPSRTKKEYNQDNREQINEKQRQYIQTNKEQIIEKKKQWYQDNREQILKKAKEKINCDCGSCHTKSGKLNHLKSKKHLDYLNSLSLNPT